MVNQCPIKLAKMNTLVNVNVLPFVSYDLLVGIDWSQQHRAKVDCFNKIVTCLNEQGLKPIIQGIQKETQVRQISTTMLNKNVRRGFQLYFA